MDSGKDPTKAAPAANAESPLRATRHPVWRAVEHWIAEHRAIWERRLDLLGVVLDDAFPTTKGHRSK